MTDTISIWKQTLIWKLFLVSQHLAADLIDLFIISHRILVQ